MKALRFQRTGLLGLLGVSVLVVTALSGAACAPATSPPPPEQGVTDVKMQNLAFSPSSVTIKKGESVRWTNYDAVFHTATSGSPGDADAGSIFDTGNVLPGQSKTIQFNDTGDFVYFCRHHPTIMFGAHVIVTE